MIALSLPADLPVVAGFNLGSLLLAVIAGLAVMLVVFGLSARRGEVDDITRRLERYAELGDQTETRERRPVSPRELLDRFTDSLNGVMMRSARTGRLTEDLARADLKLKSSEWVLIVAGAGAVLGLLVAVRFGSFVAFLPCPVLVYLLSGIVLKVLQSRRRTAFGKPLGEHEGVGFMLADNEMDLHTSRLVIWHTAWLLDQGQRGRHESSMAKVICSEAIWRVVDRSMQVLGGLGITDDTIVARLFREVRPFRIYDGPSEVHRWSIAQRVLRTGGGAS